MYMEYVCGMDLKISCFTYYVGGMVDMTCTLCCNILDSIVFSFKAFEPKSDKLFSDVVFCCSKVCSNFSNIFHSATGDGLYILESSQSLQNHVAISQNKQVVC